MSSTAEHESGHLWVAHRLGWPCFASVRGGTHRGGCTIVDSPHDGLVISDGVPFALRPAGERAFIEGHVLIALGGEVAEEVLITPVAGRCADPVWEAAAEQVAEVTRALPPEVTGLADEDRAAAAAFMSDPAEASDVAKAALWARRAHGDDVVTAARWLAWLDAQARAIIAADAEKVRLVAVALAERGELTGAAIGALVA